MQPRKLRQPQHKHVASQRTSGCAGTFLTADFLAAARGVKLAEEDDEKCKAPAGRCAFQS